MNAVSLFAFFVIIVAFAVMVISVLASISPGASGLFDMFAGTLHVPLKKLAKVRGGGYLSTTTGPRAYFTDEQNNYVVTARRSGSGQVLTVSTSWQRPEFRLRVFHDKWTPGVKKFIGMQDLEIGSAQFDEKFVLQSNDPAEMQLLLGPRVQSALLGMPAPDIDLSISGSRLHLQSVRANFENHQVFDTVRRFVELHKLLWDSIYNVPNLELRVVENDTATCMVCGEQVEDQRVDCRGCRTPHHKDCWEYLGVCSTYACGSHDFEFINDSRSHAERFRIVE